MKKLIFAAFLYLVWGVSQASSECFQVEESLINYVLELCSTYESIDVENYYSLRKNIEDVRMDNYICRKSEGRSSPAKADINIFIKSRYVLSQVDFYLKLREERKEHLDLWDVEKRVVTNAVSDDCDKFILEVKTGE